MSSGRWHITVTTPDWGDDHLSSDAIVAYVDDELAAGPHSRATRHLSACPECAAQVVQQGQARSALRTADCPSLPSSLLSSLRSIPQDTDLPAAPAGLAVTSDGQLVSVLRPEREPRPPRGHHAAPAALADTAEVRPHTHRSHRRIRFGTGVAVTGLALGAMAFALPAALNEPDELPPVSPAELRDRPVIGGAGATPVDARLQMVPAAEAPVPSTTPTSAPPTSVAPPAP